MARTARKQIAIKDEGVTLVEDVDSVDFAGAGVTGTATGKDVTETIPSGGGGGSGLPATDDTIVIQNLADPTKQMRFDASGVTAGQTRVLTIPDKNGTLACMDDIVSPIPASYLDIDGGLVANSDVKVPSQKAVKTYVDNAVTGLFDFKGATDASGNPNYPVGLKGDFYVISVAGKIGGASGKSVDVGDVYIASADNAGGTEAAVGTSWFVLEHNLTGVLLTSDLDTDGTLAANSDSKIATQKATKTYADLKLAKASNLSDVANAATAFGNIKQAATTSATGVSELTTDTEVSTGTDPDRTITPNALAHSTYGYRIVEFPIGGPTSIAIVNTDDTLTYHFRVLECMNGWNLVYVAASAKVAGTTNATTIQVRNITQAADMLSTPINLDSATTDSTAAATQPVIDTNNDDVATGDQITIRIPTVSTTPPQGVVVTVAFQKA